MNIELTAESLASKPFLEDCGRCLTPKGESKQCYLYRLDDGDFYRLTIVGGERKQLQKALKGDVFRCKRDFDINACIKLQEKVLAKRYALQQV